MKTINADKNVGRKVAFILMIGTSMNAMAKTVFEWKEEVLLYGGKKILVERSDIYDSSIRREIGQSAQLKDHRTTFINPRTNKLVLWSTEENAGLGFQKLNLISLDFVETTPYVAATISESDSYIKWGRPNPPYVFFRYTNGWKQISISEFPEKFKVNLIATGRKIDVEEISRAMQQQGFVPAHVVQQINLKPGRGRESYEILRTPLDYGVTRPVNSGPKAPNPITTENR